MSATQLLDRFRDVASSGAAIDWRKMREDILEEHERATNVADRVLCLKLHSALMDMMERNAIEPENLDQFRKTRSQDYALMLVKEAMIGQTDGNVDPVKMLAVTTREVRDGRMRPDDQLHTLAVSGAEVLGTKPKPAGGVAAKARSWFK